MHRIVLTNLDELVSRDDLLYESMYVPEMVMKNLVRYLISLNPGDMFITPVPIPPDYLAYISRVRGLSLTDETLIELKNLSTPYSLVDSILMDGDLMDRLGKLGSQGGWVLDPYIETPRITELSRLTGIPTNRTPPDLVREGLIKRLNHKRYFTELSRRLGVSTIPGYYAEDVQDIVKAVMQVSLETGDRVMLKKTEYAGGAGNMAGGARRLINALPSWYNGGGVLVEHRLSLAETAGSLVNITDSSCTFLGIDVQIIEQGKWAGFRYPMENSPVSDEIRSLSLRYGEAIRRMGARGYLNMDWAILNKDAGYRVLPIEINFRHNGMSCILDQAVRYFGVGYEDLHLYYYGHFVLFYEKMRFEDFLTMMADIKLDGEPVLIDRPGMKRGILAVTPFIGHEIGLVLCGRDETYVNRLKEMLLELQ